jgi:hypothetical protein
LNILGEDGVVIADEGKVGEVEEVESDICLVREI